MSKPRRPRSSPNNPLLANSKALQKQDEELRRSEEKMRRVLDEAPKRKAEQQKKKQAEIMSRSRPRGRGVSSASQVLDHSTYNTSVAGTKRPLGHERKEQRRLFLALLIVLAGIVILILRNLP